MQKIHVKMLKNKLLIADPLFLQHSLYLSLSRSKTLVHVSGFQKYLFSTGEDISGLIFIHTWDTFWDTLYNDLRIHRRYSQNLRKIL